MRLSCLSSREAITSCFCQTVSYISLHLCCIMSQLKKIFKKDEILGNSHQKGKEKFQKGHITTMQSTVLVDLHM